MSVHSGKARRRFVIATRFSRGTKSNSSRAKITATARASGRGKTPKVFRMTQTATYSHHWRMAGHSVTDVFREPVRAAPITWYLINSAHCDGRRTQFPGRFFRLAHPCCPWNLSFHRHRSAGAGRPGRAALRVDCARRGTYRKLDYSETVGETVV